jgi:triphosphoribosyl-dephospho-CoA synthase
VSAVAATGSVTQARAASALRWACEVDVRAFKPGNVSIRSPGHGMRAEDFLASAEAAAPALTESGTAVGERILGAIEATRRIVSCNTNLGIVLLCAPLARASESRVGALSERVARVLDALSVRDAQLAYRAIRLAQPGGLGTVTQQDVRDSPSVTLLEAMRQAAERDTIARQYATGYGDIFMVGVPALQAARRTGHSSEHAALTVYLEFLSRFPDSLIVRKFGLEAASAVSAKAAELRGMLASAADLQSLTPSLAAWDGELKRAGVNPGTSADLTVASLFAARLEEND